MTYLYVQASQSGTGVGALESTIDRIDLNSWSRSTICDPPDGYAYQYPVVSSIQDIVVCYQVPLGKNVNTNAAEAEIVVNGTLRPRPQWREGFLNLVACTWGPAGHAAISPNGDRLIHSARIDKNILGTFDSKTGRLKGGIPYAQDWVLATTDLDLKNQVIISSQKDQVEPNWSEHGLVWIDKSKPQHAICLGSKRIPSPGLAYDPIVSPDGSRVAWLVLEGKIGSSALSNLFNVNWSLYVANVVSGAVVNVVPATQWTLNTHPHWLDNNTLVWSRLNDTTANWKLWTVDVGTKTQVPLSTDSDGSLQSVWVVH